MGSKCGNFSLGEEAVESLLEKGVEGVAGDLVTELLVDEGLAGGVMTAVVQTERFLGLLAVGLKGHILDDIFWCLFVFLLLIWRGFVEGSWLFETL